MKIKILKSKEEKEISEEEKIDDIFEKENDFLEDLNPIEFDDEET
jgi:hypothetical protein